MPTQMWEIQYRPQKLSDYIFQNEQEQNQLERYVAEGSIPHLLLSGHRGTGKTTLAYILKNELDISDSDFMVINASDENSVDTIRNKIKGFISTFAISKFKMVFLDEADYLSHNAQAVLRNMMEEYADNARFILTCNKLHKIMPELQSRCRTIIFSAPYKDAMMLRMAKILKKEGIKLPSIDVLEGYVDAHYPDCRKMIQSLQENSSTGTLEPISVVSDNMEVHLKIAQLMEKGKFLEMREYISANVPDDAWEDLYKFLYEYLHEIGKFAKDDKKWAAGMVIVADHLYRHSFVSDPEINAVAMFIKLGEV